MSDYSISARLKLDDRDIQRVRREFWLMGSDVRGLARGIRATLGDAFKGLAGSIRSVRNASKGMADGAVSDFAKVSRAAFREMRAVDRIMFASSGRSKGGAKNAIDDLLAAEKRMDRTMRALARPFPKPENQNNDNAGSGGVGIGGLILGNIGGGLALRAFDAFVGGIGRVMGAIKGAADDAFDYSKRLEVSRVGIASLYIATGTDTGAAMGRSDATVRDLRRMAAQGIGGLEDYIKAYESLYTPLTMAGRSEADVRKFTRLTIAAGGAMEGKLGIRTAPIDVIQALGRGATDAQTRILSSVIRSGGMDIAKFNEMSVPKKLDFLATALERWEPAAEMMGKTIDSLEETRKDWLYLLGGSAVRSAGEDYRKALLDQIDTLRDNEAELTTFGDILGVTYRALAGIKNDIATGATQFAAKMAKNADVEWYWYERAGGGAEQLRERFAQLGNDLAFLTPAISELGGAIVSVTTRIGATLLRTLGAGANPYGYARDIWDIWNAGPSFNMEADTNASDPTGTGELLAFDGPRVDRLGNAIGNAIGKNRSKATIEVRARVDWADPRSMALSVQSMLQDVANQTAVFLTSSDATPAFPGAN